jgi:hypothetical protein
MIQKSVKIAIALLLSVLHVLVICGEGYAAPTVKLIVSPNKTDVYLGADSIVLTAKASGANLKYKWNLQGPGAIEGEGAAVFYKLPESIEGESAQAVVTVTVTDENGEETTDSFTFNILKKEETKPVAAEPKSEPEQEKKGMSTTTKVAIGAGAAVLGIGAAVAILNKPEEKEKPFTGTFKREYTDYSNYGNLYRNTLTFQLKQSGDSISGTIEKISELIDCCPVTMSASVTGTADGNTAYLSWGEATAGTCQCSWTTWSPSGIAAGSGRATLINDNRTLRFDGGAEYTRSKIACEKAGVECDTNVAPFGDFTRQ